MADGKTPRPRPQSQAAPVTGQIKSEDRSPVEQAATLEQHAVSLRAEAQRILGEASDLERQASQLENRQMPRGSDQDQISGQVQQKSQEPPTVNELMKYGNYAYVMKMKLSR